MSNKLEGTPVLFLTAFRLSVKSALPWIVGVVLLAVSSQAAYGSLFPTPQDQQNLAQTIQSNPAFNLIFGNADNLLTAEGFTAWRTVVLGSFLVSMMSILLVIKHTRAKEDSGQEELVASYVVGRYASLTAGLGVACTMSIIAGGLVAGLLVLVGADSSSSFSLGTTLAVSGIFFATVASLTAQLTSYSRTASSYAITFLGLSYVVRGVADTVESASWMSWLSPLGWAQKSDVSTNNNYLPLLALLCFAIVVMLSAYWLRSKRDFGQGVIADRPGPERAGKYMTIAGLALRLQRTSVIGWTLAFIFLGSVFGYLLSSVGDTFAANEEFSRFIGADGASGANFTFEFAKTLLTIIGIIVATYGTQLVFKLATEENDHRIEPLLAGSVTRKRLFSSYALLALAGTIIALILVGVLLMAISQVLDTDVVASEVFLQAILTIPAMLVLVAIGIAAVGLKPGWRGIAWIGIAVSFAITLLGPILQVSDRILAISPFWHVADASSASIDLLSTAAITLLSVGLVAIGYFGFRRRDIARV